MVIWSDTSGVHVGFDNIDATPKVELRCAAWWEQRLAVTETETRSTPVTFAYKIFKEDPGHAEYDEKGVPRLVGEYGFGTEHAGPEDGVQIPFAEMIQSGIDLLRQAADD